MTRLSLITSLFTATWLSRDHLRLSSPSHHVNCAPLIQTIYGVIFVPPPYTTHRRTKLRTSAISTTRFYLQSWINMHLCAQGSSPYDLMLLGIVRKSENKNQPAASLKGAGDAPNLNQTIDTMQINALLFGISFSTFFLHFFTTSFQPLHPSCDLFTIYFTITLHYLHNLFVTFF